jgi:predicted anti-sigma-YlaC factor YlaD
MESMALRICLAIILLFSVLFLPFWVSLCLAIVGMVFFSVFIEAVALLLLSDLLFGARESRLFNVFFVSMIISVVLLVVIEFFKSKSSFYNTKIKK